MYELNEFMGLIVKQAREEKGWTQQYLADEIEMDIRTLRKIESGQSSLDFDNLVKLIYLLDISPNVLFHSELSDVGLEMDKLFRQLLKLDYENLKVLCDSALYIRKWHDENPDENQKAAHHTL